MVQHHAAIALGKTGGKEAIAALLDLLDRNDDDDVVIRHAASYALSLIGDAEAIHHETKERGPAARLGAVLALRRLDSPLLTDYLDDEDPLVAAEAARAIYDKRLMDALPALAALSDNLPAERMFEPVMRRVIEANVRLADIDSAMRLAQLAANVQAPEMWRELALQELDQWSAERNREGVWGSWWPRDEQTMKHAIAAMMTHLPAVVAQSQGKVQDLARTMMQKHVANATPDELAAIVLNDDEPVELRIATLSLLAEADQPKAADIAAQMADSAAAPVPLRIKARGVLIGIDEQAGLDRYVAAIESGELIEKQDAIKRLGAGKGVVSGETMIDLTGKLERGELDPELRLDVVQAVQGNQSLPLKARVSVQTYVQANAVTSESPFIRDAVLAGGSIERGLELFTNHPSATCLRCHSVGSGATVGPDLASIGSMHDANYLYHALVNPHADIADGFASSAVTLKNGQIKTGRIIQAKSTPAMIVLANSDGQEEQIERNLVVGMPVISDQSLMPTMTDKLSAAELRDVLAYLVSLKGDGTQSHGHSHTSLGPQLINPAKGLSHMIWLPSILLGISAGLGALLLATVLTSGKV